MSKPASFSSTEPEPALRISPNSLSTNAVNRNLSDLHAPTWLALLSANVAARTVFFHPIQLAISRKRVTRDSTPPTVWGLIGAAYRGGCTSAYPDVNRGRGTGNAARYDFGRGGVRGVYRGVGAALLCNLAGETSYLFTLEAMKEYVVRSRLPSSDDRASSTTAVESEQVFAASSTSTAVGAMCGDLVALLLVTPLVIVCNRQMTAGYSMAAENAYMSIPRTFRSVWGLHQVPPSSSSSIATGLTLHKVRLGFSGLYQGFSAGLLRIPSSGCWWGLYTKSKEAVYTVAAPTLYRWEQERLEKQSITTTSTTTPPTAFWQQNWLLSPTDNPLLNAIAGILASVFTTLLFNPIAVIQTRQQSLPQHFWVEESAAKEALHQRTWRSVLPFRRVHHVANDLVKKEGVRGFFKGAPANILVAVLDGIIFTLLFEFTKLGSDVQYLGINGAD